MRPLRYSVLLLGLLLLLVSCGSEETKTVEAQKVAVEVEKAEMADIVITRTYSGTLEGAKQSEIYATIPERIIELPVSEGTRVQKGQVIIVLDKGGPSSQYYQANAVYQNAKDNYEKMQSLFDQKAISEIDYKGARTAYEVALANFNAARATVELQAPIEGILTDVSVNLGQQAPMGVPLATVASTRKMRLTVYVGLHQAEQLRAGLPAKVYINSGEPIAATIVESSKSADPQTRLFRIELEMENPKDVLKPGMFARAEIQTDKLQNVLSVSNRALYSEEGVPKTYVIRNDSAFAQTLVTGETDGVRTEIKSGLAEGDEVVTVGKSSLRDATPVIISGRDSTDVSG